MTSQRKYNDELGTQISKLGTFEKCTSDKLNKALFHFYLNPIRESNASSNILLIFGTLKCNFEIRHYDVVYDNADVVIFLI